MTERTIKFKVYSAEDNAADIMVYKYHLAFFTNDVENPVLCGGAGFLRLVSGDKPFMDTEGYTWKCMLIPVDEDLHGVEE